MTLAIIQSRTQVGIHAPEVTVEIHLSRGLPGFSIVGLAETAVKESKERVRSAILTTNFDLPAKRIIINLAPADMPKEGTRFDLPIALGILAASRQIPKNDLSQYEFAGELALSGELRPISGILPFALSTKNANRQLIIPKQNADEAALIENLTLFAADNLTDVCAHLCHRELLSHYHLKQIPTPTISSPDLADVQGQQQARRALEIAAAGGHSILFIGPPGTGKTMLASRLPTILPPMSEQEALESAAIASISHKGFHSADWKKRPFRMPHHSASSIALVGGGTPPKPGEISLANHGVLFLDELPEFSRHVLESLREPLESGSITISRAAWQCEFPAHFQFIAAMNPCPCGHLGDPTVECRCTPKQIQHYHNKISGPFLDRIDMYITVPRLSAETLTSKNNMAVENSETVQKRVVAATQIQLARANQLNAKLTHKEIKQYCPLEEKEQAFIHHAIEKLQLSARSYHRILKVSRTIADLSNSDQISCQHLAEAINFHRNSKNHPSS